MLKEPEIKLFGRKISLPEHSGGSSGGGGGSSESSGGCDRCFEERREDGREGKQEQIDEELAEGEVCDTTSREDDDHKTNGTESGSDGSTKNSPTDGDVESGRVEKSEMDRNEKTTELKKPDKILPCPRCSSMDTKFCYYNNYNVNQPRHFCKSCQRYWTAGGTMRNVPVGAGRRKNKSSAPHCRHITISEHPDVFKPAAAATVLSFAPDKLPTAAAAATSRTGPPPNPSGQNGFRQPNANGFPCVPWPYPWSSAVPVPAIFPPPGYPVPCYLWNSGGWSVPWVSPAASEAAASSPTSTLGKHPRSVELLQSPATAEEDGEGRRSKRSSIVVPKTLRIDDPEEAARSSIWSTLGINYDSVGREGLFKALQPKGDFKKQPVAPAAASSFMQANPAALSRSLKFQEAV